MTPNRLHSLKTKAETIELVIGHGLSPLEVALSTGIYVTTIYRWIKEYKGEMYTQKRKGMIVKQSIINISDNEDYHQIR